MQVMDEGKLRKVSGRLFPEAPSSARYLGAVLPSNSHGSLHDIMCRNDPISDERTYRSQHQVSDDQREAYVGLSLFESFEAERHVKLARAATGREKFINIDLKPNYQMECAQGRPWEAGGAARPRRRANFSNRCRGRRLRHGSQTCTRGSLPAQRQRLPA